MSDTPAPPPPPPPHNQQPADEPSDAPEEKKRPILGFIILGVIVIIIMAMCSGGDDSGDDGDRAAAPSPTATATEDITPAETTPPEEIASELSEEPAEPAVTETPEAPTFEPVILSGSGDDVVDVAMPADQAGIITITYDGGGNFSVISYDPAGERIDLLANVIGSYQGTRPVNLTGTEPIGQLEITASGPWTAEIRSLAEARVEVEPIVSGSGPDVFLLAVEGANSARVTHDGTSNFAVIAWGSSRDLLVNEIGAYEGTVRVPPDTILVDVDADGAWMFDFS